MRYLIIPLVILLLLLAGCASRQAYIHERGSTVMPFNLNATTHIFTAAANGGLQQVIVTDSNDTQNIELIRAHLKQIAEDFADGDFSDPTMLHGEDMPGISTLEEHHNMLEVRYMELPDGAQIMYASNDTLVITAIHDWFDAQLVDHGKDATDCPPAPEGHSEELWAMHHGC